MMATNRDKLFAYWKESSEDDLGSAIDIVAKTTRYTQAMFFLHLAVEKAFKAAYVKKKSEHAPFAHNLIFLSREIFENVDPLKEKILLEFNEYNIECRYPDDIHALKKRLTKDYLELKCLEAREIIEWIFQS